MLHFLEHKAEHELAFFCISSPPMITNNLMPFKKISHSFQAYVDDIIVGKHCCYLTQAVWQFLEL